MPVTTFVSLVLTVTAAAGITIWALIKWGMLTVLPVLAVIALAARWATGHVPLKDPANGSGTP